MADKWKSFGWHTIEVIGHNLKHLHEAFSQFGTQKDKPFVIIAHTIKGKGVSFMEDDNSWHQKAPNQKEFEQAMAELEGGMNDE